ncbi:hypothetical protein QQX98_000372 [Neonectria punicea]|uniref:Uncharacterized protein n=1 Tax=Neonectria punicea TaxID=979145 RepID=A0ABR1HVS8_9HYPO
MSASSQCLDVDIDETMTAIVEWECNDVTHYLTEPDHKTDGIKLQIRFCAKDSYALFELHIPLTLKGLTLLRLGFHLSQTLDVLVPIAAKDPLSPIRVQSGKVLDALRMLSKVTSFGIYIESIKLPKAELQAITDAVTLGRLKPFRCQERLNRMYHGTGAKVADLSTRVDDAPPLNKRRVGGQDEPTSQRALAWAEFNELRQMVTALQDRERDRQREDEDRQAKDKRLRRMVTVLKMRDQDRQGEIEAMQAKDKQIADDMEDFYNTLLELREGQEELSEKVDFISEHGVGSEGRDGLAEEAKNLVFDELSTLLSRN